MSNKKNALFFVIAGAILIVLIVILSFGWLRGLSDDTTDSNLPTIAVSIYPMYAFISPLYSDSANVELIAQGDPHFFEPTPSDVRTIKDSDYFIYNGIIDEWVNDFKNDAGDTIFIDASEYIDVIETDHAHSDEHSEAEEHTDSDHEGEEKHEDDSSTEHSHNEDPHYWVEPGRVRQIIDRLGSEIDLEQNQQLINDLQAMEIDYRTSLNECSVRSVVVDHNAFGYLAESYRFQVFTVYEDEEKSSINPRELLELTDTISEQNLEYLLVTEESNPEIQNDVLEQLEILPLNTIESSDSSKTYIDYLSENLNTLQTALNCE